MNINAMPRYAGKIKTSLRTCLFNFFLVIIYNGTIKWMFHLNSKKIKFHFYHIETHDF